MRIDAFESRPKSPTTAREVERGSFREILESVGRYEQNAERALRRVQRGDAQFEDLLALQVEVQMWSHSNDLLGRVAGQVSRSVQELARSSQ